MRSEDRRCLRADSSLFLRRTDAAAAVAAIGIIELQQTKRAGAAKVGAAASPVGTDALDEGEGHAPGCRSPRLLRQLRAAQL